MSDSMRAELRELREQNQLLSQQIDRMRGITAERAVVFLDLVLDGIGYCVREADNPSNARSRIYAARIDVMRVALGLPPRPHVERPDPEALPRIVGVRD